MRSNNVGQNESTNTALYYQHSDKIATKAIDAVFSQSASPSSSTDLLFDHASWLGQENLHAMLLNLTSMPVKNGKVQF